jgi:sugar O-acyltransferase (sialic acid O-acetyltransferase NeuD family)
VSAAQPLLLVGSGGLAREVAQAVRGWSEAPWELLGFLDDDPTRWGGSVGDVPVLGPSELVHEQPSASVLVCTGRPGDYASRARLVSRLGLAADRYATVVHPTAWLSPDTQVGAGTVLLSGVVATASVRFGAHVAVMPGCVLTHDDVVDDFATLASRVVLGGSVRIGRGAYLGAGSMVREGLTVGAWSLTGMGSLVLCDVPSREMWFGSPATHRGDAPDPVLAHARRDQPIHSDTGST